MRAVTAITFFCAAAAYGADLQGTDATGAPGATVIVPINLVTDGSVISGLQFDAAWDDSALGITVVSSEEVRTPGKSLDTVESASGTRRCLLIGAGKSALTPGPVVRVYVFIKLAAEPGTYTIDFQNTLATDADGNPVELIGHSFRVEVRNSTPGEILDPAAMLNSASLLSGPIAPGEIVSVFGRGSASQDPPASADQISVFINGRPAPILYAGANQINAVVPFAVEPGTTASVNIHVQNRSVALISTPIAAVRPAIFTQDGTGAGPAAVLNQNFSLNSHSNAAERGSVIMVYATGFGLTEPAQPDGQISSDLFLLSLPVSATVGGVEAEVLYAGSAPGLIAGLVQVNVRIPASTEPSLSAPLILEVGGNRAQPGVTVAVK